MKKILRSKLFMIVLLLTFTLNISISYAHKMYLQEIEEGKIQILYSDDSFPTFGEVILYTEDYVEVYRGVIDEQGTFQLPPDIDAYLLVANDGLGHQLRWKIGEDTSYENNILLILSIVILFIVTAILFDRRIKKKTTVTN